jgi:DNA-binding MarR family transcriptional regulator
MKDEELLEAFEKVELFIEYRYRKSHGTLFSLLGVYFFIILIFSEYGSEICRAIGIPVYVLSIGLFILFIFLYLFFVGTGFHIAHTVGLEKMEGEKKTSFRKRERISYLSVFVIIASLIFFIYYVSSFIFVPYHAILLAGMAATNILIFLSVRKIYGTPHYHEELLWLGVILLGSAFMSLFIPNSFSILFAAFIFLGSYTAASFHIYADAGRMLDESVRKELGSLFSSKSKLSHPVRLGIMIVLKRKKKMIFSEIQKVLRLTPGNLSSHLNYLERGGYVSVRKGLLSAGPRTIVKITSEGEEELKTYLSRLKVGLLYEK